MPKVTSGGVSNAKEPKELVGEIVEIDLTEASAVEAEPTPVKKKESPKPSPSKEK